MAFPLKIFYIGVVLCLFLSGYNVLYDIGYYKFVNSDEIIEPAFFFFSFSFLALLVNGIKIKYYKNELRLILFLIFVALFNYFTGRDFLIKQFFPSIIFPVFFTILVFSLESKIRKEKIKSIVYFFLIVECSIAILEKFTQNCLFPTLNIDSGFNDWGEGFRSFALMGHPLSNSSFITYALLCITISEKSILKKNILSLLCITALLAFNSRFTIVIGTFLYVFSVIKDLLYKKIKFKWYLLYFVLFISLFIISENLLSHGFGDRLINKGLNDGSSQARVEILDLFTRISLDDLFLGLNNSYVIDIAERTIREGFIIENCWAIFLLRYGIIFLSIGVILYSKIFIRYLKPYSKCQRFLIIFVFFLLTSSTNSLAAGANLYLTRFFLLLYILSPSLIKINKHESINNHPNLQCRKISV